ncbi:MAG TPA: penicillin-binding transpeptidase domain-containing protein [Negativicutes bacterium]
MSNDRLGYIRDNIRKTAYFFLGLLIILFIYLSYIQVVESDFLANHPLNRRTSEAARKIPHGNIVDKNGKVLAYSEADGETGYKRDYPFGASMAHVVGYDSVKYGKTGIEGMFNAYLSGMNNPERQLGAVSHLLTGQPGNHVMLTLDAYLQETAYKALGNHRGAVVAISPRTGAILAMVSKPSFDPNTIDQDWSRVSQSSDSLLLNRATQGLYPPGSIIKVMIADAALTEKIVDLNTPFNCEGSLKIGPDYVLSEPGFKAHGQLNLEEALAVSCNITFGSLALKLGSGKMNKTFERYGFPLPVGEELQESSSHLPDFSRLSDGDLAQTGIGQGSLLVTPLRMAMLASAFANKGSIMQPYLVQQITAPDGTVIKRFTPKVWLTPTTPQLADTVGQMMVTVVNEGTGTAAQISKMEVAGKTGTAENPHGDSHAWFIGFAPADDPQIAIAVIVENGGSGGGVAAPIARQIFMQALR